MNKNLKMSTVAEYLYVFSMVFLSMDTLLFGTNANPYAKAILVCLTGILAMILPLRRWVKSGMIVNAKSDFLILFLLLFILMISHIKAWILSDHGVEIQYIYNYLIILFLYELSQTISANDFCTKYINIMTLIAGVAVLLFCVDSVGLLDKIPSITITNTSGYRYYYFGLGAVMEHLQYHTIRAYGIFREPGVFSIYLCIAVGLILFFQNTVSVRKIALLSVAIVLTFSTAGYLILIAEFFLFVFLQSNNRRELFVKIFVILAVAVFAFVALDKIYSKVFGKLHVQNDSLNSRLFSIVSGFDYSLKAPILGKGWSYVSDYFATDTKEKFGVGNVSFTNTYLRMAATYGWIYTTLMLNRMWYRIKNGVKSVKPYCPIWFPMCIFAIWLIMFSNEGMVLNPLLYVWMFRKELNYDNNI